MWWQTGCTSLLGKLGACLGSQLAMKSVLLVTDATGR